MRHTTTSVYTRSKVLPSYTRNHILPGLVFVYASELVHSSYVHPSSLIPALYASCVDIISLTETLPTMTAAVQTSKRGDNYLKQTSDRALVILTSFWNSMVPRTELATEPFTFVSLATVGGGSRIFPSSPRVILRSAAVNNRSNHVGSSWAGCRCFRARRFHMADRDMRDPAANHGARNAMREAARVPEANVRQMEDRVSK